MTPVKSSNIRAVDYSVTTHIMTVEFNNFARWRYLECLPYHAEGILAAESAGKYFNQHIKGLKAEKVPDIVNVLKAGPPTTEQLEDAAAQIEQLRADVVRLTRLVAGA